jgi:hypothetical protein
MVNKKGNNEGERAAREYVDTTLRTSHYKQSEDTNKRLDQLEHHVVKLHKLCEKMVTSLGDIVESVTGVAVDDRMTDIEADSNALASAGHGMDEDYGGTDKRL